MKALDAVEATKIFEEKKAAEELKKSQTLTQEQEIEELKKQVKEMQDIIANQNSEEEAIAQEEDEETKQEVQRGDTKKNKGPYSQNFMLVVGAAPGGGVKSDTKLIRDIVTKFLELYNKLDLTIEFPRVL